MTLNKDKIQSLVGQIRDVIGVLGQYKNADDGALLASEEKLGNIKYRFIVAAEACIDICNHIAAKGLNEAPESYSQCFEVLGKHGIIQKDMAQKMSHLARLRNLLVHLYWKVDDRRVIEMLRTDLSLLGEFASAVAAYAATQGG